MKKIVVARGETAKIAANLGCSLDYVRSIQSGIRRDTYLAKAVVMALELASKKYNESLASGSNEKKK